MEPPKRAPQPASGRAEPASPAAPARRLFVVRGAAEAEIGVPLAEPLRLIRSAPVPDFNAEFLNAVQAVDVEKVRQLARVPGVDLHVGLKIANRMWNPERARCPAEKAAGLDVIIRLMAEAAANRM